MSVSSVSNSLGAANAAYTGSTTSTRSLKQTLGSDDFMKLLAVQFQSQDPMKPMEDTAFIAQMAQFSSLEQSNSMVKEMTQLRADQQNLAATGMLGRTVTVTDADGKSVSGQVGAVENSTSGPTLVIDGVKYPISSVVRIENTPVPAAQTPAA